MSELSTQAVDESTNVYRVWWAFPDMYTNGKFIEVNAHSYLHAVAVSAIEHVKWGKGVAELDNLVPYLVQKLDMNWVRVASLK